MRQRSRGLPSVDWGEVWRPVGTYWGCNRGDLHGGRGKEEDKGTVRPFVTLVSWLLEVWRPSTRLMATMSATRAPVPSSEPWLLLSWRLASTTIRVGPWNRRELRCTTEPAAVHSMGQKSDKLGTSRD